jgi:ribosomal protein L12E/L44/L45/RPP1/RPP2
MTALLLPSFVLSSVVSVLLEFAIADERSIKLSYYPTRQATSRDTVQRDARLRLVALVLAEHVHASAHIDSLFLVMIAFGGGYDQEQAENLVKEVEGKHIDEVVAAGKAKITNGLEGAARCYSDEVVTAALSCKTRFPGHWECLASLW